MANLSFQVLSAYHRSQFTTTRPIWPIGPKLSPRDLPLNIGSDLALQHLPAHSRTQFVTQRAICFSPYLGGWVHAIEKPKPVFPCLTRRFVVVNGVRPPLGPSTAPNPRPGPESPVGSSSRCRRKLLSSVPVSDKNNENSVEIKHKEYCVKIRHKECSVEIRHKECSVEIRHKERCVEIQQKECSEHAHAV